MRLPVWLCCSVLLPVLACGPASIPSRHILLISIDTLRADYLGEYGHPLRLTPEVDRLAAQGVLFERAYAPASYTLPSIAALLTGRYPEEIGIQANPTSSPTMCLPWRRSSRSAAGVPGLSSATSC